MEIVVITTKTTHIKAQMKTDAYTSAEASVILLYMIG